MNNSKVLTIQSALFVLITPRSNESGKLVGSTGSCEMVAISETQTYRKINEVTGYDEHTLGTGRPSTFDRPASINQIEAKTANIQAEQSIEFSRIKRERPFDRSQSSGTAASFVGLSPNSMV